MLRFLPAFIRGIISSLILTLSTLILCWPLFIAALLKFLLPFPTTQRALRFVMHWIAETWIGINNFWIDLAQKIDWNVEGVDLLDMQSSRLVTSNHQSWVDILALQYQFNRRIPLLKFFLKQELIWVPVIGLCWWALEFPFMKRYSKAYLAKHPEKQGQDLATTRKACERYKTNPVSVFNFLEGTRFTQAKHTQQQSPYQYLLKPKAGGIAFVLDAMGEQLKSLVNVTIYYPEGKPTIWCLLSGKIKRIVMRVETLEIPPQFIGKSYDTDLAYRQEFQQWVNQLWSEKDQLLQQLHQRFPRTPHN
ncbi:acyltransferase [Thiopseudomonas alkaliphila]|uniref:acyltransferase n=1 Tax=Thiopseudomonas alkaliphila TaxID=1697053 RepID=UPI00069F9D18|nr:acyltransferase [Thiopseudomonas alkaliphila]AKX44847.1 acyltransferase [Thiopseudomonas alkaliphila]AKX47568.1 acyltransferase [Thiopseudomonas alkaliphila]AKX51424.1 acyltransferase [Thiopseudomonas alkaliphila]AKX53354.1 acyltransferase [Thiopseudomonas alkaliphila]AKX57767.1 acyltransferase [Thiopseudomonas alkaliphila]